MPEVINGCGTWYYGKNRVHRIPMTCPNCGAYSDLESYDTTKYVVLFFVPLIPLSKWRVVEKCPVCTQHRAIKLKDWEEAKQKDSAAVTEELRKDPQNPETVQKVIGVATGYQDENLFLQVAEKLARPMTHHADVQATLGAAYAYFGRRDQAEQAYKASLAVKDDPQVSEQLALQLLRQGRPQEAETYLQHALTSEAPEQAGFVHLLGEGYLADGQIDRGLELLDKASAMEPTIRADKEHQKLRKKAEKARGSAKPIPSPLLTPPKKAAYEEGGVGGNVAAWIGPLIAAAALAFYLSLAWSYGNAREVHVVNGLDVPYSATIAGQTIELQPGSRRTIEVPEGTLHISATAGDKQVADTEVELHTSFFARPFLSRTFIVNPDRTALLAWEKQFYAENPANAPDAEFELFVGETLYEFNGIDYEFESFPMQLQASGSGSIAKTRVAMMDNREVSDLDVLIMLPQMLEQEQFRQFLETRARFAPGNEKWVFSLQSVMPPDEYIAFLREGLDDRPLHVNWHRAYQSVMQQAHPEHDLAVEYDSYLAEDPGNADLLYLAGRAATDIDRSIELFRQATQAEPPSAFAANALAYQLIGEGKFEEAVPLVEQAVAADPDSMTFDQIHRTLMLATGQYDKLIQKVQQRSDDSLGGLMRVSQIVEVLGYNGDGAAARQQIDEFVRQREASGNAEFAQMIKDSLLTTLAYTQGDIDTFLQRHAGNEDPGFDLLFIRGDLEQAAEKLAEQEQSPTEAATSHLALFLKAHAAGNDKLAQQQLELGIEALRKGTAEEREFAEALSQEGPTDAERLLRLPMMPEHKRVVLAALGVRDPEHSQEYFALARKLNFERSVPWAFLQEFLAP
jgi:tetratricopeptide (TPR) repeat protein